MTYDKLREGGVQWPCTEAAPDGTERLYADARFGTDPDFCETFGHDPLTGAAVEEDAYRALAPAGRAFLRTAAYEASPEVTSEAFPLLLTTGRTVYHFHTRTKTARAPQLEAAAPDVWVEVSVEDASALGLREGDRARVESPRGAVEAPVRVGRIRPGVVFVPFHHGWWDRDDGPPRAANELTLTSWDPVSKQPIFKVAAVRVHKVADGDRPSPAPTVGGSAPADPDGIPATVGGPAAQAETSAA